MPQNNKQHLLSNRLCNNELSHRNGTLQNYQSREIANKMYLEYLSLIIPAVVHVYHRDIQTSCSTHNGIFVSKEHKS